MILPKDANVAFHSVRPNVWWHDTDESRALLPP